MARLGRSWCLPGSGRRSSAPTRLVPMRLVPHAALSNAFAKTGGRLRELVMAHLHVLAGSDASPTLPDVRKIAMSDLKDALAKGIDDFWAFPTHVIFLSIIYP